MTHIFSGFFKRDRNTRWIRLVTLSLFGLSLALMLTGCDDDENFIPQGSLRVLHTSPDAPPVNVKLDGKAIINDLDYANSSGFDDVLAKSYDIVVEGIVPGGNVDVITVPGFPVADGDRTTIIAADVVASIEPLVVSDSAATPASDEVALRVVHASPAAAGAAATVDVYVTAPGDDINAASPALSFAFKEDVDAGALPAGTVQIRATAGGTKTVVYDSGPVDLSPFAGSQLLIAAIDTTNSTEQAASPVKLLVATDNADLVLLDAATASGARVVHASPDANGVAGPVEVWAASPALPVSPTELIDAFSYTDVVPAVDSFVGVPGGAYVFSVGPDTDTIGDSVYTSGIVPLVAGNEYTVVASGRVANAPAFDLLLAAEELRSVVTQASLNVIHAAPAAGTVQVYVTPAGDFSVAEVEGGMAGAPLLPSFAFGDITGNVAVAPSDYDIRVVAAGTVAINVENFNAAAGSVTTIIARGPSEPAVAPNDTFGVIVLTN